MLKYKLLTCLACAMLLVLFFGSSGLAAPKDAKTQIEAAMPSETSVKPKKERHLLFFSGCYGFRHGSIGTGKIMIEIMAKKTGAFKVELTDDPKSFHPDNLKKFDAVMINNCTQIQKGLKDEVLRKGLIDFVKNGGGFVGIHSASDGGWPEYTEMLGGRFAGHPWGGGGTWGIQLEDPKHPIMKGFDGKDFKIKDELYNFKDYDRTKQRVLMGIDLNISPKKARPDKDQAVTWIKSFGKGRVYYCSLGHNHHIFWDAKVLQHYLDGIQFALGDLEVDTTPLPKK